LSIIEKDFLTLNTISNLVCKIPFLNNLLYKYLGTAEVLKQIAKLSRYIIMSKKLANSYNLINNNDYLGKYNFVGFVRNYIL